MARAKAAVNLAKSEASVRPVVEDCSRLGVCPGCPLKATRWVSEGAAQLSTAKDLATIQPEVDVKRATLTLLEDSHLCAMFSGRWEDGLAKDKSRDFGSRALRTIQRGGP